MITCEHHPCRWPDCACEPDEEEVEKAFYDNMTRKEALAWQKARDTDVD